MTGRPGADGEHPSRPVGWGAGLVVVMVMTLFAGGVTFLTERIFCAVAPNVPFLGDSCGTAPWQWALVMGGAVGGISLVALLVVQLRSRR